MSILGSIVSTVLGHGSAASAPATTAQATPESKHDAPHTTASTSAPPASAAPPVSTAHSASAPPTAPAAPGAPVDVDAVLTDLASKHHERLDWKHSIVDLLKVLNLDSSLAARKELAHELHYSGDEHDTATMNIWLHRQVIAELAKNGGKVPADLHH
jgi:hypothetical protein